MLKRGNTFNLTGGEFVKYYDKAQGKPTQKSEDEKLVGADFQLTGLYCKTDDGKEFYFDSRKAYNKWVPMPLDPAEKSKILEKLGKEAGTSERAVQTEYNNFLEGIMPDQDLLVMAGIDPEKVKGPSFAELYKAFRVDFLSQVENKFRYYDIRNYRYLFYPAAYKAKIGTLLRQAGFQFPPPPLLLNAGLGSGLKGVVSAGEQVVNPSVIPVLIPPQANVASRPVPRIGPLQYGTFTNEQMAKLLLSPDGIQTDVGRMSITQYVMDGGILDSRLIDAIQTMSQKGKNIGTRNKLSLRETERISELMRLLNSGLGVPNLPGQSDIKADEVKLQTANVINTSALPRIIYELIGQIDAVHGLDSPIKNVQAIALLKGTIGKMTPDQINRILAILNAVDINAPPSTALSRETDTFVNRAGNIFRGLPVDRQSAIVLEIRKIMRETQSLTPAQSNYLQEKPVQRGQQGLDENRVVQSMGPLFDSLENVFLRSVEQAYIGLSNAQVREAYAEMRADLERYYMSSSRGSGFSPEIQAANLEATLELFMEKLVNYAKDNIMMNGSGAQFNFDSFKTFVVRFISIIKDTPEFSFDKLKEDIKSGALLKRLTNIYSEVEIQRNPRSVGPDLSDPSVLRLSDALGQSGNFRDDNLESPEEYERFINGMPAGGASVLESKRDVQQFANQLFRDAAEYKRTIDRNLIISVRNFRVWAGDNLDMQRLRERFFPQPEVGEYYGIRPDPNWEMDDDDFDVVLEEARPDGSRIRRFLSLKNLSYLASLLGFAATTVGIIIQNIRNARPGEPPEVFPPVPPGPQPPVNPPGPQPPGPVTPAGPDGPPVNPPVNPPGPPVGPVTPDRPVSPTDTPTIVIPGQPGQPGEKDGGVMSNPDWGEGTERQYFKDPNELELFAMTKLQQEKDFRNFTEFSLFQPNNGLGNARTNPLIRENIKDEMRRFKNNFEYARPVNMQLLTKDRPQLVKDIVDKSKSGKGCMNFTMPVIQCDFGRVHFEDENVGIKMGNSFLRNPDYETQFNEQMYLKNGMYNPDRGLYKKGVNQPNYKPVKIGESNRNSKHFGVSKDYRQDELSQKSFNINNQDSQINDYGKQIPFGFNFGNTQQQDFPTEQLLKTNLYSGLRYNIALKKK